MRIVLDKLAAPARFISRDTMSIRIWSMGWRYHQGKGPAQCPRHQLGDLTLTVIDRSKSTSQHVLPSNNLALAARSPQLQ